MQNVVQCIIAIGATLDGNNLGPWYRNLHSVAGAIGVMPALRGLKIWGGSNTANFRVDGIVLSCATQIEELNIEERGSGIEGSFLVEALRFHPSITSLRFNPVPFDVRLQHQLGDAIVSIPHLQRLEFWDPVLSRCGSNFFDRLP